MLKTKKVTFFRLYLQKGAHRVRRKDKNMKNTKSLLIIITAVVLIITTLAACSNRKADETVEPVTTSDISTTVETTTELTTEESTSETTSEADEKDNGGSSGSGNSGSGNSGSSSSGSSNGAGASRSGSTTTTKKQTTTQKATTTTQKQTTTTTTTTTTTQKNVSASEVQAQVNAYIKSKGITLDSSMTPNNASWTGDIWASQERLNNGKALQACKNYVDLEINELGKDTILSMYCYFDGIDTLYVLYW